MIKLLAELFAFVFMLILPSSATTAEVQPQMAQEAVVLAEDEEVYSHQSEGVMLARFENILNHNYCFGDDFLFPDELISGAAASLINLCEDGLIPAAPVDEFVYNMYGKTFSEVPLANGEYYAVLPRGFNVYRHTVTDYAYLGDGRIAVTTSVVINPEAEKETAVCESVFFADGSSIFGYNLLECNIK